MVDDEPAGRAQALGPEANAVAVPGQDQQVGAFGGRDDLPLRASVPLHLSTRSAQPPGGGARAGRRRQRQQHQNGGQVVDHVGRRGSQRGRGQESGQRGAGGHDLQGRTTAQASTAASSTAEIASAAAAFRTMTSPAGDDS